LPVQPGSAYHAVVSTFTLIMAIVGITSGVYLLAVGLSRMVAKEVSKNSAHR
jgi:hypothetical protein